MNLPYPSQAGYRKQSTSKEAAEDINKKLPHLRDKVLQVIQNKGKYGATPEEVASLLHPEPLTFDLLLYSSNNQFFIL